MPLFRKKSPPAAPAQTPAAPEPPVPPFSGDKAALYFQEQLAAGRWQEFHDFLEASPDWDLRHFYVNGLADITGRPPWLDEWVAAHPVSALPLLFRGRHATHWAWQARGSGRANTVKEDAWQVFHTRIVAADQDLARAAVLDDRDPTTYAFSITTGRALSLGQPEIRRRYAEVARRDPLNGGATAEMIQATARKWGGSHDGMFAFAREVSAAAPDGHSAHKAVALAHIEMWLDQPREEQPRYFLADEVKAEIRAAADRSIRSPRYHRVNSVLMWSDRNVFTFCFRLMQDYEAQLAQMQIIGPWITKSPWNYQGKPGMIYERARQRALTELSKMPPPVSGGRPAL
ncbi:MAG TPA: DUF4034 domain-containing protein [Trebonia sp.]